MPAFLKEIQENVVQTEFERKLVFSPSWSYLALAQRDSMLSQRNVHTDKSGFLTD